MTKTSGRFPWKSLTDGDQLLCDYANRIADIFGGCLSHESHDKDSDSEDDISSKEHVIEIDDPTCLYITDDPRFYELLTDSEDDPVEEDVTLPKVIFDQEATTLIWNDGTKVTVKAFGEPIDHEKGYAMAIAKYIFLDKDGHWYNRFNREIQKAEVDEARRIASKVMKDIRPVYKKAYEKAMTKLTQERMTEDGWIINGDGPSDDPKDILTEDVWLECSAKANKKAYDAALRYYRSAKQTDYVTGLDPYVIDDAVKDAIENYYTNMLRQH